MGSSLFSSPGKQASQAASGVQQSDQQAIDQYKQYVDQKQAELRGAIAGLGPNPYFSAAQQLNPAAYQVNPGGTNTFGMGGPGMTAGSPTMQTTPGAPPPQNVFLPQPPPPTAQPPTGGAPGIGLGRRLPVLGQRFEQM